VKGRGRERKERRERERRERKGSAGLCAFVAKIHGAPME